MQRVLCGAGSGSQWVCRWREWRAGRTISQPSSGGAYSGGGGTHSPDDLGALLDGGGGSGASFEASVIGFHGIIIGAGTRTTETARKDPMLSALTAAARESTAVVIRIRIERWGLNSGRLESQETKQKSHN